jgi:hypothetical protein
MLPDIDVRLQAIVKTLQDIVLPALPSNEQQAREQVTLINGQLAMIESQWKVALKFELGTYAGLCRLGTALLAGIEDPTLHTALRDALNAATDIDRTDYDVINREVKRVASLIDRIISDHTIPMPAARFNAVLAYGLKEAWRNRVWFSGTQVDPERADLPSIDVMLSEER